VTAPRNQWSEVPGKALTDAALSALVVGDSIYLFGKGINVERIYFNRYDLEDDTWAGWSEVPGDGFTDAPIAVVGPTVYDGIYCLHLFVKGLDDHIYWNPTNNVFPGI
jgi:hypothetical protein